MALACISFYSPDQPIYDCMDRISKTSVTCPHTTTSSTATTMFQSNQTDQVSFFSRSELNIIVKSRSKWDWLMILSCAYFLMSGPGQGCRSGTCCCVGAFLWPYWYFCGSSSNVQSHDTKGERGGGLSGHTSMAISLQLSEFPDDWEKTKK